MYQSNRRLPSNSTAELTQKIKSHITQKNSIRCNIFNKRDVSLEKYLEVTTKRRASRDRLRTFFIGCDILKYTTTPPTSKPEGKHTSYECIGTSACNRTVVVHVRDEYDTHGNRKLYLISTFLKK